MLAWNWTVCIVGGHVCKGNEMGMLAQVMMILNMKPGPTSVESSSRDSSEDGGMEHFMNLRKRGKVMPMESWVCFHANPCRAKQPAAAVGGGGHGGGGGRARIAHSCMGCGHLPVVTAPFHYHRVHTAKSTWSNSESENQRGQEKKKCSENHERWINEGQVMKGLQRLRRHRKHNKEQPGIGFNWKEASSHLGSIGASGFDVGVS